MTEEQLNDVLGWNSGKLSAAKAYSASQAQPLKDENQRLRDMLKAIIDHSNEPAMDDALFRKFARANAQDVLNEEGGDNVG